MSRYDGIDYSYAPESYWVDSSIRQSILRNIKGTERRKLVDEALRNGNFDLIEDELIGSEVFYDPRLFMALCIKKRAVRLSISGLVDSRIGNR